MRARTVSLSLSVEVVLIDERFLRQLQTDGEHPAQPWIIMPQPPHDRFWDSPENRVQDLIVIMLDEGANLWEERLQRLWVLLLEDWAVHCPWYVGEPSVHLVSLSVSRATYCCNARSGP